MEPNLPIPPAPAQAAPDPYHSDAYQSFIPLLRHTMLVKRPLAVAPTFVPQNAFEQWQIYENGATRKLYVYINATWRSVTLT